METSTKPENGSPAHAVESKGTGTASTDSERNGMKVCQHPFCGCISQSGYLCRHGSECEPLDADGRRFTVTYIEVDGQRLMCRDFGRKKALVLGVSDRIIDADAAIASTPFADAKPFDPARFVSDRVGS